MPVSAVGPGPPIRRPRPSSEARPAPRRLARAQAELDRTGRRAPGARLSPTEQQIAELVVAGKRTNREVAEALFMSPHTVEAHLTRIYQSLGVRRRTGSLGCGLARASPTTTSSRRNRGFRDFAGARSG